MQQEFQHLFSAEKPTVFGRSRRGKDLEEYRWGDKEKSILFLSGFTGEDLPLSDLLHRWKNHLEEAERYGGILGDFDLKNLKNKCRIRLIPLLNPDACEIDRNGLINTEQTLKKPLKQEEDQEHISVMKTNFRGVDLNRNFNANWLRMRLRAPHRTDFGPFPESEAETASLTALLRRDPPDSAVLLRYGENALYYPRQATAREIREAVFLGHYASLPVRLAEDTDGTALQWLTDRGCKAVEIRIPEPDPKQYPKLRDLLTMCAALTQEKTDELS